jgi:mannosyltransferase OCH1-like enzyme
LLSDYARIKIIYEEGGIYLDIDVELIKNLDDLLNLDFYMGFQSNGKIGSGLGFGSTKNNLLLKKIIEYYESLILNSDYVFQPCPIIETKILEENGFLINGIKQKKDDMYLLPQDFFDPIGFLQDEIYITKNTYSIHHYTFSWGNVNDPNYKKYKV